MDYQLSAIFEQIENSGFDFSVSPSISGPARFLVELEFKLPVSFQLAFEEKCFEYAEGKNVVFPTCDAFNIYHDISDYILSELPNRENEFQDTYPLNVWLDSGGLPSRPLKTRGIIGINDVLYDYDL